MRKDGPVELRTRARRDLDRRGALTSGAALIAVVTATVTGCFAQEEDDMELTTVDALEDAVGEVWRDGGRRRLDELVDVDFEDLVVVPEGTPRARVNELAGGELVRGEHYQSSTQLFLFRSGARAVLAAMVVSDVFDGEVLSRTFGPEATLVGAGRSALVIIED